MFYKALLNREIFEFITGQGEYFIQDREYDGHNPLQSFKQYVETCFEENEINVFNNIFWKLVNDELQNSENYNLFLENLISLLLPYYSIKNQEILKDRVNNTPLSFIKTLKNTMRLNENALKNDKKGIGSEWNQANQGLGIWGGIIYLLQIIKDRSNLDLIPN